MPESSVHKFGEWIVNEDWDSISGGLSATDQSVMFEQLINQKLNQFCPEKEMKLWSQINLLLQQSLRK